jgi:outer membrane protein OmpA-like peptidoglycan-associated protein
MRRLVIASAILALSVGGSTACATKKFVKTRVGEVNDKVETLTKSVEDTQDRTKKNEEHLSQHDQQIAQVDQRAVQAGMSATDAHSAADKAAARVDAVDKAAKRLVYEVTLSEDQAGFKFGQALLPDEAKSRLDELVQSLKANPNGAWIEVEGYTDGTGPKDYNQQLGLERAEAVKRYLYTQYQIPLHKINVISFGSENPVAPNTTREGRAKNRRVVIKVLT